MAWCMDQTRAWSLFFILASFTDSVSWGGCWQLHPVGSGLVMKRECLPSPNPCKIPLHLLLWLAIMPITHPRQWPGACSTPTGLSPSCQRCQRCRFDPWVRKNPWRRAWQPTPVFSPGKFYGQKSLAGYSAWGHKDSDATEHTIGLSPSSRAARGRVNSVWSPWTGCCGARMVPLRKSGKAEQILSGKALSLAWPSEKLCWPL